MSSFVSRLAAHNGLAAGELAAEVSMTVTGPGRRRRQLDVDRLAAVSGVSAVALAYALPEVRRHLSGHAALRLAGRTVSGPPNVVRPACRRCMAAKAIVGPVLLWTRNDRNVCPRHLLWIGEGVRAGGDQLDVCDRAEIVRAQSRHRRLVRRHGHRSVLARYEAAYEISDWSSGSSLSVAPRWQRRRYFADRERTELLAWSYHHAAHYPEVVAVLSVLSSPFWWRMAISTDRADRELFLVHVGGNGITNGDPASNTPLRKWMVDQRWRHAAGTGLVDDFFDPPGVIG